MAGKIKTVKIYAHCRDCCNVELKDENGNELKEHQGYVPDWFPAGGGDDVRMEIDNETGKILNWESIKDEVLEDEEEEF